MTTNIAWEITIASFVAFLSSYILTRVWVIIGEQINFKAPDMNKPGYPEKVVAGGTWTLASIAMGLLVLEAIHLYLTGKQFYLSTMLALGLLVSLTTLLGFIDDFLSYGIRKTRTNKMEGVSAVARILLMIPISLPLVAVKAGYTTIDLPLIGIVNLGIAYSLVLVPIGVMGAANAFNMLAGYNGLEAGMGIMLLLSSLLVGFYKSNLLIISLSIIGIAGIIGFLIFNWYPAKTFPGNSFTYGIGSYYAGVVIVGNFEKYGVAVFLLYFIELLLFIRAKKDKVKKVNFADPCPDGSLRPRPENMAKSYSLTHIILKILLKIKNKSECPTGVKEYHLVIFILLLQLIIIIISFLFLFII